MSQPTHFTIYAPGSRQPIGECRRFGAAHGTEAIVLVGGFTERIASLELPARELSGLMPIYVVEAGDYKLWRGPLLAQQKVLIAALQVIATRHKKLHLMSHSAGSIVATRAVVACAHEPWAQRLHTVLLVAPAGFGRSSPRNLVRRAWKEIISQQWPRLLQHARRTVPVSLGYAIGHPIASLHELYGIAIADIRGAIGLLVQRHYKVIVVSGARDNLFATQQLKSSFKGHRHKPIFQETPDAHNDILIDPDNAKQVVEQLLA